MISTEKEWFGLRVAKSMSALGFESWLEVETCLSRCLWTENCEIVIALPFGRRSGKAKRFRKEAWS